MDQQDIIRDLIYFDFEKTASIVSQIEGGLPKETRRGEEAQRKTGGDAGLHVGIFKGGVTGTHDEKTSLLESRVLHHDLLVRLERRLFERRAALDLNDALAEHEDINEEAIRAALDGAAYVRAEGWAKVEDYRQFEVFGNAINNISATGAMFKLGSFADVPEVVNLKRSVDQARHQFRTAPDGKKEAVAKARLDKAELALTAKLQELTGASTVPEWQVDGLNLLIDTFMPNRIAFRVWPFEQVPSFQVVANLKRQAVVDTDLENLLHAYTSRPTVKLTMFGLVTDVPNLEGHPFAAASFGKHEQADRGESATRPTGLQEAFGPIFRSMEVFEELARLCRYPSIAVYPLAVYRTIRIPKPQEAA